MTPRPTSLAPASSERLEAAFEPLTEGLYRDLKRIAHGQLGRRRPWETVDTTGLVHEAFLKLTPLEARGWRDRGHFLAAAAQAMRHFLVDAARRRLSHRHGSGRRPEPLDTGIAAVERRAEDLLAVDDALEALARLDERLARLVECRFFIGFTEEETAEALGVSARTVRRDWIRAKGWLRQSLGADRTTADAAGSAHG